MMKDTQLFDRRAFVRTAVTLILALCLCLSILPAVSVSADSQDDAMNKLVRWGVVKGEPDGGLYPGRAITRAEFVALTNRAYGYKETGNIPFLDVPYDAWYYDDISIAYNARYFDGTSATTAEPEATLTREQAMTLMARSMRLDSIPGEVTEFSDGRSFSSWSRGYVKAAYRKGLIGGYTDGTFKPLQNITRGEMALLMVRALGTLVYEEGEQSLGSVYGNVTINTSNVTLHDTTIVGDLYITGGLGLGSVVLENVRVLGSIIVAGGGVSEAGQDSVVLRNVRADELKIDSLTKQYLSVRVEGDTLVSETVVRTDAYIQDRTQAGEGLLNITLEGANGKYTLAGNLEKVVNKAPGSTLKIARGTLGSLTIDEAAVGSKLSIENDATVKEVNLDTAVNVTGSGDIGSLNVNAEGSSTSMLPDDVNIRPGITANVFGETMDTELGRESSSDPRILAGYPKAADVAPTTMTATVATNKSGTLYWAVSSITDGSVGETELISPSSYGSKAVKYGTLQVGKSNTELKISVSGLTTGGNYYFSAVLVDARNNRSPVKVMSFSTPDNTVPAFASGYPTLITNWYYTEEEFEEEFPDSTLQYSPATKYYAEFYVKSTKSCTLYWAVFTKGSSAPTAAEFRSQSLSGSIAKGTAKAERNADVPVRPTGLRELTDYDIYFWLCDFDGTKSSAVKKVTFKTVDGTPPEFNQTPIPNGQPKATSISLTTNVNEAGTVYWVAVPAGKDYPSPRPSTISMEDHDYYILQVVSGMNGIKNGKVSVKANTDAAINISGLAKETSYDIWYIAMDTAGNYSVFYTRKEAEDAIKDNTDPDALANYVTVSTLDTTAPIVDRYFSNFDITDPDRPYPDTDIILTFNEDVLRTSHLGNTDDYSLWTLALMGEDGKEMLTQFLRDTITLHYYTPDNKEAEVEKKDTSETATLNYENVEVTRADDGKGVIVTFKKARLDSGTYYWFVISGIADTSTAHNAMSPIDFPLKSFITVSSKVILSSGVKAASGGSLTSIEPGQLLGEATGGDLPGRDNSIPLDIAFTMTPQATSREDASREWDMLIWANVSVTFEVYRRELPGGEVKDSIQWEKLPHDGSINLDTNQTNAGTFLGLTLFKNFDYVDGSSIVTPHPITELKDDGTIYQYGIHILSVEDNPTRGSWSKNVTFQFNIVTGTNLRNDLTEHTINEAKYTEAIDSGTVDDITEALRQSLPFQLTKPFEDTMPPNFSDTFPTFLRSDTAIDITVATNRPATLYWIVTPVGSVFNAYDQKLALDNTKDKDEKAVTFAGNGDYTDEEIKAAIKKAVEDEDPRPKPEQTKLSSPMPSSIYRPSPTSNNMIKIGSAQVDTIPDTIMIDDLAPSTGYFIYFVLKGSGPNSYSNEIMLYKVATTPPDRPVLTADNINANMEVDVSTADKDGNPMAATVDYILIPNTNAAISGVEIPGVKNAKNGVEKSPAGLDSPLKLNCADLTKLEAANNVYTADDYTLLKALSEYVYEGRRVIGTVFDFYASEDAKNGLATFITGSASGSFTHIVDGGTVTLPTSGRDPKYTVKVDCNKNNKLSFGTEYIFLGTARNDLTEERGFKALSPVGEKDNDPPAIKQIFPMLYLSRETPPRLSGTITVVFDKTLYYKGTTDAERINKPSELDKLAKSKTSIDFDKTGSDYTNGTNTFTLLLTDAMSGANLILSPDLCNSAGAVRPDYSGSIKVNIETTKTTDKSGESTITTEAVVTVDDWNSTFIERQIVEYDSVGVSAQSLAMTAATTANLTAKVTSFTNTPKPVTWSSSNTAVATVSDTGVVTALKAGKATISASITSGGETVSATCEVTVSSAVMTLSESSIAITEGGTLTLTPTITPTPSGSVKVDWSSSNEKVATVGSDGTVKGVGEGTATITAKAKVGNEEIKATCTVKVLAPSFTLPGSKTISRTDTTGFELTLTLNNIEPYMIKSVEWKSSDYSIVTYTASSTTTVTGVRGTGSKTGSADIYAEITTMDGRTYTSSKCTVTVTP